MNSQEPTVSKRLHEVWQWKEATYREVADLPTQQALEEILKKARLAAEGLHLPRRSPTRPVSPRKE